MGKPCPVGVSLSYAVMDPACQSYGKSYTTLHLISVRRLANDKCTSTFDTTYCTLKRNRKVMATRTRSRKGLYSLNGSTPIIKHTAIAHAPLTSKPGTDNLVTSRMLLSSRWQTNSSPQVCLSTCPSSHLFVNPVYSENR
jgi:hypothetical protein